MALIHSSVMYRRWLKERVRKIKMKKGQMEKQKPQVRSSDLTAF
jgi:hypothetical protein